MEAKYLILTSLIFIAVCAYLYTGLLRKNNMQITSNFTNNGKIPSIYTCDGENIAPKLKISGIPLEAKTLAIIVDDPDAPAKTWVHWLLFNVQVTSTDMEIEDGATGIEGTNDFKEIGYGGPCPPSGTHRYHFKAYALSDSLDLSKGATREEIEEEMQDKILAQAELVGLYQKNV